MGMSTGAVVGIVVVVLAVLAVSGGLLAVFLVRRRRRQQSGWSERQPWQRQAANMQLPLRYSPHSDLEVDGRPAAHSPGRGANQKPWRLLDKPDKDASFVPPPADQLHTSEPGYSAVLHDLGGCTPAPHKPIISHITDNGKALAICTLDKRSDALQQAADAAWLGGAGCEAPVPARPYTPTEAQPGQMLAEALQRSLQQRAGLSAKQPAPVIVHDALEAPAVVQAAGSAQASMVASAAAEKLAAQPAPNQPAASTVTAAAAQHAPNGFDLSYCSPLEAVVSGELQPPQLPNAAPAASTQAAMATAGVVAAAAGAAAGAAGGLRARFAGTAAAAPAVTSTAPPPAQAGAGRQPSTPADADASLWGCACAEVEHDLDDSTFAAVADTDADTVLRNVRFAPTVRASGSYSGSFGGSDGSDGIDGFGTSGFSPFEALGVWSTQGSSIAASQTAGLGGVVPASADVSGQAAAGAGEANVLSGAAAVQAAAEQADCVCVHLQIVAGPAVKLWLMPTQCKPGLPARCGSVLPSASVVTEAGGNLRSSRQGIFAFIHPKDMPQHDVDLNMVFTRDLEFPIGSKLGAGAFGQVHRALLRGSTPVAVKVLGNPWTVDQHEADAMVKEISILAKVHHPNIVKCFGGSATPPLLFLVEELMERSLADVLQPRGCDRRPLPLPMLLRIAIDVAEGLFRLHPTIVHRDLKPANILLSAENVAKIADFGVSRMKAQTYLTTRNMGAGTIAYMAPECLTGEYKVSEKADIWGLGIILWEMAAGRRPWEQYKHQPQIIIALADKQETPRLDLLPPSCPTALRGLIEKCWQRDPSKRPSAGDIGKRLSMIVDQL